MPGIGSITSERRSSQASLTCCAVAPRRCGDLVDLLAAAAQREERDEDDSLVGAEVDDLVVLALLEAVLVLDRRDRDDAATEEDLLDARPPRARRCGSGRPRGTRRSARASRPAAPLGRRGAGSRGRSSSVLRRSKLCSISARIVVGIAAVVTALGRDHDARPADGASAAPIVRLALTARVEVSGVDHLHAGLDGRLQEGAVLRACS